MQFAHRRELGIPFVDRAVAVLYIFHMNSTYSITQAQAKLPGLVREAQAAPVLITRHDQTVAYLVSKPRMDAIAETLELLANPDAMKAIRASRKGRLRHVPLNEIDPD